MSLRVHPGNGVKIEAAPGSAPGVVLPISRITQEQTNWCWAACCQMVLKHIGITVKQCELASYQFAPANCCFAPASSICNQGAWPDNAYKRFGVPDPKLATSAFSFGSIQLEINSPTSPPIEPYYAWTGGGSHVALVIGWYPDGDVHVVDPWPSYSHGKVAYQFVLSAYNLGNWNKTYWNLKGV